MTNGKREAFARCALGVSAVPSRRARHNPHADTATIYGGVTPAEIPAVQGRVVESYSARLILRRRALRSRPLRRGRGAPLSLAWARAVSPPHAGAGMRRAAVA